MLLPFEKFLYKLYYNDLYEIFNHYNGKSNPKYTVKMIYHCHTSSCLNVLLNEMQKF